MFVEVALSRDQQILSVNCNSRTTSEVQLIDLTTSRLEPFLVQPRQLDLLYHVEHWRRWLIILANTGPGQEYQVTFVQHIQYVNTLQCIHKYNDVHGGLVLTVVD